jgi:hypothetical protein
MGIQREHALSQPSVFQGDDTWALFAATRCANSGSDDPERRLLHAVLRDAIECWQRLAFAGVPEYGLVGRRQRDYREAEFWLFGQYDNAPFFSFTKICDCLGLDPDFIRGRLLGWKRAQTKFSSVIPARSDSSGARGGSCSPARSEGTTAAPRPFTLLRTAEAATQDLVELRSGVLRGSPPLEASRRAGHARVIDERGAL